MCSFFPFILAHWTRYFLASSTLPLASSQRADSGSHLNSSRGDWHVKHRHEDIARFRTACKRVPTSTLPPGHNDSDAGHRHCQHQVSPVSDEVSHQGQEHVSHAPRQTHDGTSEGPVFHVSPLDTWAESQVSETKTHRCKVTFLPWIIKNRNIIKTMKWFVCHLRQSTVNEFLLRATPMIDSPPVAAPQSALMMANMA